MPARKFARTCQFQTLVPEKITGVNAVERMLKSRFVPSTCSMCMS